ncbi:MAG: cadherin-like domain-containing protein, partial [Ilumatobacter sp.]|nr:cadherin-like domain-containing protein [Ilumatobacter sp.]
MVDQGISWRRAWAVVAAVAVALTAAVVVARADGFEAVDATVPRATRWFVDTATDQIVLVDGFAGRSLARLAAAVETPSLELVQSAGEVVLIDRNAGTVRDVDAVNLRLGPPQPVGMVAAPTAVVNIGQAGLVAVDTRSATGVVVPPAGGDPVPFELGAAGPGPLTQIAADGAVWTLAAGRLSRITSTGDDVVADDLDEARFTLVGNRALLLDVDGRRARFDGGDWVDVPTDADGSELLVQENGPRADCGWVIADDDLWCIGSDGIDEARTIVGLDADGADRFAVAGDAAALVRRSPAEIVRIDWRAGVVLDDVVADVPASSDLEIATSVDLIWVDDVAGDEVWAIHPWGISAVQKNDGTSPLLGESGELLEEGTGTNVAGRADDSDVEIERPPDDNGIDDPPVANPDPVTARAGAQVQVPVTANDYDPDGEAVVLVGVDEPSNGTVEIANATTVAYLPDSGFVGVDEFEYTIADGNGTEAHATVTIELLPIDAPNRAPLGTRDTAQTGPGVPVVVDVLLNDVDPERDAIRIESFTQPDFGGTVSEVDAPSGLRGLRFSPDGTASGSVTFTYRPVDSFGAEGEP